MHAVAPLPALYLPGGNSFHNNNYDIEKVILYFNKV